MVVEQVGTRSSWSVGELGRACGLSVRALRRTGLSLRRIAALLDELDPDPVVTLRAHVEELNEDLRRRGELRDRLAAVLASLENDGTDDAGDRHAQVLMRVIESMTMFEQYVHGYDRLENERLSDQAGTLVELLHGDTSFAPGTAVLEIGCGVGAQTRTLAERSPGAEFTCVDISPESLAEARRRTAAADLDRITFSRPTSWTCPPPKGRWPPVGSTTSSSASYSSTSPTRALRSSRCAPCSSPAARSPPSRTITARPTSIPTAKPR